MLTFCNHYTEDVWLCYSFYSPDDCGGEGGDWQTIGWFHVVPGSCVTPYANDLDDVGNRYWYFYAHSQNGEEWSGPYDTLVDSVAFNVCDGIGTTAEHTVGMQQLDVGDYDNYTVNLTS